MAVASFEVRQVYHAKKLYSKLIFFLCHFNNLLKLTDPVAVKNQAVETESLGPETKFLSVFNLISWTCFIGRCFI